MGTLPGKKRFCVRGALSALRCTQRTFEPNMKSENTIEWNVSHVGRTLIEFQIKKFQILRRSFRFYFDGRHYTQRFDMFFSRLALGILRHCYWVDIDIVCMYIPCFYTNSYSTTHTHTREPTRHISLYWCHKPWAFEVEWTKSFV